MATLTIGNLPDDVHRPEKPKGVVDELIRERREESEREWSSWAPG